MTIHFVEYSNEYTTSETSQTSDGNLKDTNMSDILLWAIFANRKELAEICWLRGENHLCNVFILVLTYNRGMCTLLYESCLIMNTYTLY